MKNLENAPKIYVGTHGQYNSGSLFGKWFDLTEYSDLKEFLQDCFEFHRNELDPELMFQDWENIPDFLISECSLHKEAFAYFEATSEMDDETAEAFEIYCKQINYCHLMGTSWKTKSKVSGKATKDSLEALGKTLHLNTPTNTSKTQVCCQVCHRLWKGISITKPSPKTCF